MPIDDPIADEERKASDAYALIRMRLDRLEKNIDRLAPIPAMKSDLREPKAPQEFVRNVVGSSAAAGSAEFHIYRNNRKKEQNRLDYIAEMARREELDEEYKQRREEIEQEEEEKTAKRRAKREKRKQKAKLARRNKDNKKADSDSESDEDDEEEEPEVKKVRPDDGEKEDKHALKDEKNDEPLETEVKNE